MLSLNKQDCAIVRNINIKNDRNSLTHEIGHLLGLYHIQGPDDSNCSSCENSDCKFQGDRVCDTTPYVTGASSIDTDCDAITPCFTHCGLQEFEFVASSFHNFMEGGTGGTDIDCLPLFTNGQSARMRCMIENFRPGLINREPENTNGCTSIYPEINQPLIINNNVTWDNSNLNNLGSNSSFVNCDIIVKTGGELKISKNIVLHMCDSRSIIIEPGGTLILEGKVTSVNGGTWKGISVLGTGEENYVEGYDSDANNGILKILGGEVSNAEIGAKLYGATSYNSSGGKLLAQDANFIDNNTAVKIENFNRNYDCFIRESKFVNNSNGDFESFIDLTDVYGINIISSSFVNSVAGSGITDVYGYGYGIWAKDAGFSLRSELDKFGNPDRSYFSGLDYGVYINGLYSDYQCTVRGVNFQNCYYGIYNNRSSYDIYTFNKFNLGNVPDASASGFNSQYGIILNGAQTDFTIEQNEFTGNKGNNYDEVGFYCNSIGTDNSFVSKNTFKNLSIGARPSGTNGANMDNMSEGLILDCNTFDQTAVKNDILATQSERPLKFNQRFTDKTGKDISAGNLFSQKSSNDFEEDYIGNNINYYFNSMIAKEDPISIGINEFSFGVVPNLDCGDIKDEFPTSVNLIPFNEVVVEINPIKEEYDYTCSYHVPYPHNPFIQPGIPENLEYWINYTKYQLDSLIRVTSWTVMNNDKNISNEEYEYLLNIRNNYSNDMKKVKYLMKINEWEKAYELSNTLVSKWSLSGSSLYRHNLFIELLRYLKTSTTKKLNYDDIDRINEIASTELNQVGFFARAILNKLRLGGLPYHNINPDPRIRDIKPNNETVLINVFPNPITDKLTISVLSGDNDYHDISIYDIHGKPVKSLRFQKKMVIDVSDLINGVYFYDVKSNNTVLKNGKIIKL